MIGIVGGDKVGKTTFITAALDLKSPPSSRSITKKVSLDGSVYMVCLLEIPSKEIFIGSNGTVTWSRLGMDSSLNIDGLLVLHDTTQPAIFPETVHLLGSFISIPGLGARCVQVFNHLQILWPSLRCRT